MTTDSSTVEKTLPANGKAMLWTGRVLSAIPILFMGVLGVFMLIAKPDEMRKGLMEQGYPANVMVPLMLVELACIVLYAIPKTAVLGAILLTGYLGGAVATHVRAGESQFWFAVIAGVIIWLGLYFRDARIRALVPFRQ